jgi:hypothetical protein
MADTLRYDGTTLTLVGDDGNVRWSGRAYSGNPGSTAAQQDEGWVGPLPEGTYTINPNEISHVTGVRAFVRNLLGDWGNYRVPLHPAAGTDTHGRSGFMLHGGKTPGSAGCIDVCKLEGRLFPLLQQHKGPITVRVNYPSPTTVPTPPRDE